MPAQSTGALQPRTSRRSNRAAAFAASRQDLRQINLLGHCRQDKQAQQQSAAQLTSELLWLEGAFDSAGPYLAGEQFSLVDAAIIPWFLRMFVLKKYRCVPPTGGGQTSNGALFTPPLSLFSLSVCLSVCLSLSLSLSLSLLSLYCVLSLSLSLSLSRSHALPPTGQRSHHWLRADRSRSVDQTSAVSCSLSGVLVTFQAQHTALSLLNRQHSEMLTWSVISHPQS